MKLTFKTLQQEQFFLDVDDGILVKDLKLKIEEQEGSEKFAAPNLKLIHAGKVLEDDNKLSEYNVKEKEFIVVFVTKPKPKPVEKTPEPAAPVTPAPAQPAAPTPSATAPAAAQEEPSTRTETMDTTTTSDTSATITPAADESTSATATASFVSIEEAESAMVTGSDFTNMVENIIAMGFERPAVMRALRASFNNPDRAVEYLMTSIPEVPVEPPAAAAPPAPVPQRSNTPVQDSGSSEAVPAAAPAAAPAEGSGAPAEGSGAPAPFGGMDPLEYLSQQPQFPQMRSLVQSNHSLLPVLLRELGEGNPELLEYISQNQERFVSLLNQPLPDRPAGAPGANPAGSAASTAAAGPVITPFAGVSASSEGPGVIPGEAGTVQIQLTPQDRAAIDRLVEFGFEEQMAIQAYFACEKNEDLAADFLFSQND